MTRLNAKKALLPLFGTCLLMAACSRNSADPDEVAAVFARHSFAPADPAAVKRAAASGKAELLRSIDPYAAILPPGGRVESDYPGHLKASAGLTLWRIQAGLEVVTVFVPSPAAAAGLSAGDIIKKLGGADCTALTPQAADLALYGERGGVSDFEAVKKSGAPLSGQLKKDLTAMPSVWGFVIPGENAGYLRLSYFSENTAETVKKELEKLTAGGEKAVVLDLRHNYGGSLEALSATLALFASGPRVLFKAVSSRPGYSKDFAADKAGPFPGLKLALLTDNGTSSRAEIFAASLREAGRAFTAGGSTMGDVSVTKTFRLKRGGALRLTVARLVTPAGTDLEGKGLAPDVPVADPLEGDYAFSTDYPPPVASADPVLQAALQKLRQ
jgi:carboxyl-terminal processing protease